MVILILAIGIGANTVIFGVVDTLMLRPVRFDDPDRLVRVLAVNEALGIERAGLALGDFRDFREEARHLEGLAAYTSRDFDLTGDDTPVVVTGTLVSPDLFSLLEVKPAEGRSFVAREERPGEGRVAILDHQFRREHFGDRPVVGRGIELDGERYEIVGVMPDDFDFPGRGTQVWVPLTLPDENPDRLSHFLGAVGRLSPDSQIAQASAEMETVAATLAERFPDSNRGWSARSVSLVDFMTRPFRPALLVLSGGVALLLLIACANVANLLLVRATGRQREMAIRAAIGSSRKRIVRLLLMESLLLAFLGAGLGLVLAHWGFKALVAFGPSSVPGLANVDLDLAAYLFTCLLALLTGLGFGAVPALQLSRVNLHRITKATSGSLGRSTSHMRSGLVVVEVALALVLVVGAALMLKGFLVLNRVDLGFDPAETLVLQVRLAPARYETVPPQIELFESLLDETRSLAGVTSAAAASSVPLVASGQNLLSFEPEPGILEPGQQVFTEFSAVTPDFFRTLGVPLVAGRDFKPEDDSDAPPVVIVSQDLANLYWPGRKAVGQRLFGAISGTEPVSHEVVGVVGDVRYRGLAQEAKPAVYTPYRQVPHRQMMLVARGGDDPASYAPAIRQRLLALDDDQPIARVATFDELMADAGGQERFYTGLLSLFGSIGLFLAAVGIYGVITYTFARRKQEIAIRMALGADSSSIFSLVLREGVRLTLAGAVLGLLGALGLGSLLSNLLYGVSPKDPWIFSLALVTLLGAALFATSLSARRAARIDTLAPLRQEEAAS